MKSSGPKTSFGGFGDEKISPKTLITSLIIFSSFVLPLTSITIAALVFCGQNYEPIRKWYFTDSFLCICHLTNPGTETMNPFALRQSGCPVAGATTSFLPFSLAAASTIAETMYLTPSCGVGRSLISPCRTRHIPFLSNSVKVSETLASPSEGNSLPSFSRMLWGVRLMNFISSFIYIL